MTVIARLEVTPVAERTLSDDIAKAVEALDGFDVTYEIEPMGTVIEADSAEEVFAAAQAAHEAVDGERVLTSLEIDDLRGREQHIADRVSSVEDALAERSDGG